jgi:hypothetical protein
VVDLTLKLATRSNREMSTLRTDRFMDALEVQIASHLADVVDVRVGRLGGACMWYYGQRKEGLGMSPISRVSTSMSDLGV